MSFFNVINKYLNKYEEFQRFNLKKVLLNNIIGLIYLIIVLVLWTKIFMVFSENFIIEVKGSTMLIILNAIILTFFGYGTMIILSGLNKLVYYFEVGVYNLFSFILPIILFTITGFLIINTSTLYIFIISPIGYFIYNTVIRYNHVKKLNSFFLY